MTQGAEAEPRGAGEGWAATLRRARIRARLHAADLREWLAATLAAEEGRIVLWLPVALGFGIALYFASPVEPSPGMAVIAALALVAAAWTLGPWPRLRVACVALAAVGIGFSAAALRANAVAAPILDQELKRTEIAGRLVALEGTDRGLRLVIEPVSITPAPRVMPERVRISYRQQADDLWPGQWIAVRAALTPPPAPVMPGAFDFGRAAWFQGIGATGYALSKAEAAAPARPLTLIEEAAAAMGEARLVIARRIRDRIPGPEGAIAAALIAGDRSFIPRADLDAMRDSSLAHLLSISGLHMAIVALGLFGFARTMMALVPRLALDYPVKKWAAGFALLGATAYLALSGAAVPTVRSYIMIALMLIAVMLDRQAISLRVVAISAALILLATPESLLDPSFQMSYAAVIALVAAYEALADWRARRGRTPDEHGALMRLALYIGGIAFTSLVAGTATAPFSGFHFGRYATYGLAANVLAMPVVGLIVMPCGIVAMLLMPFGLEAWPLQAMAAGIDAMLGVAHWVAAWPGAVQATPAWPVSALALTVFGGLWLAIWRTRWRLAGLAPVLLGLAISTVARGPDVLIEESGRNVAVRGEDGFYTLAAATPRFDTGFWLERDGDSRPPPDALNPDCTENACAWTVRRNARIYRVVWLKEASAASRHCANADVIVASAWLPECTGPALVIDGSALRRAGAYALTLSETGIAVETVGASRGRRLWNRLSSGE